LNKDLDAKDELFR